MKSVAFYTLGCKVNQVETEQIKEEFMQKGYRLVDFNEQADIYIINTCTVTHVSDRKSRAMLRRAARYNPEAVVVAIGCLPQVNAEQLAQIEGVNLLIGNREKENTVEIVEEYLRSAHPEVVTHQVGAGENSVLKPVLYQERHQRTRAFVKIQDGCESFCTYCIVPYARGPVRSKHPEYVINEVQQLVNLGYKEIVLTGIHAGMYGMDLLDSNLLGLLQSLTASITGEYRLRLGSVEPLEVTPQLINLVAENSRICRHFHVPLQSGSSRILKAMNRRYNREQYREIVQGIAERIPGAALTTDVMVGFPAEEEKDFHDTFQLLQDLPIFDLHVFKYSRREGTAAAEMLPQVPERIKQQRSQALIELAGRKRRDFIVRLKGQELQVLVERAVQNIYTGLSDNYVELEFSSPDNVIGEFVQVMIKHENSPEITTQRVLAHLVTSG